MSAKKADPNPARLPVYNGGNNTVPLADPTIVAAVRDYEKPKVETSAKPVPVRKEPKGPPEFMDNGLPNIAAMDWQQWLQRVPTSMWDTTATSYVSGYLYRNSKNKTASADEDDNPNIDSGKVTYIEKFEGPFDLEYVKEKHGPGDYRVKVYYKSTVVMNKTFSIAGTPLKHTAAVAAALGVSTATENKLVDDLRERIREEQDRLDAVDPATRLGQIIDLNLAAMNKMQPAMPAAAPPVNMLDEFGKFQTIVDNAVARRMPATPVAPPTPPVDAMDQLEKALDFSEKVRSRFNLSTTVAGETEPSVWPELIREMKPTIANAINQIMAGFMGRNAMQQQIQQLQQQIHGLVNQPGGRVVTMPSQTPFQSHVPPTRPTPGGLLPIELTAREMISRAFGDPNEEYDGEGITAAVSVTLLNEGVAQDIATMMYQAGDTTLPNHAASMQRFLADPVLPQFLNHAHGELFTRDFIKQTLGDDIFGEESNDETQSDESA